MPLTHLSLFSGIGGLDLAAEMAGIQTVGQCEWADFQTKVLEKHWPNVPRWRDIRTLTAESFYEKTGLRTVDILSGGFPCQPFSLSGKRKGKEDDRYLWPEMFRVIREIRPTWVVGENVPGIVNLALDTVLSDLENEGYSAQAFLIPACGVDAPHKRERCCILAYSVNRSSTVWWNGKLPDSYADAGKGNDNRGRAEGTIQGERRTNESGTVGMADGISDSIHETVADSDQQHVQGSSTVQICRGGVLPREPSRTVGMQSPWKNWMDEPRIPRVVDGIPNRLYGGVIDEQGLLKENSATCYTCNAEMRNVWCNGCENEPASYRLYKTYGGDGTLHEMPCKGTFKTSGYCNVCSLWKNIRGKMAQKNRKDMQQGMPCGVWEDLRTKTMEHFWDAGEPNIPRVIDKCENRVDRVKSLGNAVVPQQFYIFFKLIADIESGMIT